MAWNPYTKEEGSDQKPKSTLPEALCLSIKCFTRIKLSLGYRFYALKNDENTKQEREE